MEKDFKRYAYFKRFFSVLFVISLLGMLITDSSHAAEKRLVKVAFFPMQGYHLIEEDGSFGGMDVEYLEALCEYTNWQIEYVICDSWEDALKKLEQKEVDLVGSAQYSAERAEIYSYADLSSGYTFGVIATNAEGAIAYEDFKAMEGITFGMVKNYVRSGEFYQYLLDHGIENPKVLEYDSTAILREALNKGEIDALVHTFTEVEEGQRLIGRFAPRPFYYISYKENMDIMRELNQAIADLQMSRPELSSDLMHKFYESHLDKTVLLTTEEKAYIKDVKILQIGYLDGNYPFSYEEDGEFKGLTRNMLEENLTELGLTLKYKKYEKRQEAESALKNGEIEILAYCAGTEEMREHAEILLLEEYAEVPVALVMDRQKDFKNISVVATTNAFSDYADSVLNTSLNICETQQDCLVQVRKGIADAALCDGYLVEYLLSSELQYSNLDIDNVLNRNYTIHLAVKKGSSTILADILKKNDLSIDARAINEYVLKESNHSFGSINQFLNAYSIPILGIMLFIIALVIVVSVHMINDSRKIQKLMYKDAMLDIWNLNYFIYWGESCFLSKKSQQYAVACFNLAQLRQYSIIYGWSKGEEVLRLVVERLNQSIDVTKEIYARAQGDKFVLLLAWDEWDVLIRRLREMQKDVEEAIFNKTENRLMTHTGVYKLPNDDLDLRRAVNYATQALEAIGDNNVSTMRVYDDFFEEEIRERLNREKILESANINRDFVAYYQSKVDIRNSRIVGAEALVRFLDPSAGGRVRTPWYFVPYYEKTGKITEIDFFVLEETCKMLRRRMDEGKEVVPISCNFTRLHFIRDGFTERFEGILEKYQIPKELIEVEITETVVVEELQQKAVKETLEELHNRQIRLSIDDFGSGYSSLGVFEQIPASVVKLDRSFFLNQKDRGRQVKIMCGIVRLAETLDAKIVCEGVETAEDVALMEEIKAYVAQGYYFSKPIPEQEFEEKLDMQEMNKNVEYS